MKDDQSRLDDLAANLAVQFKVLDNLAEQHGVPAAELGAAGGMAFRARVALANRGAPISGIPWELHLALPRRILAIEEPGFSHRHVTGDHHVIVPADPDLDTDESFSFTVIADIRLRHRIEVLPRWYLTAPGLQPRVIAATDHDDVNTFVAPIAPCPQPDTPETLFDKHSRERGETAAPPFPSGMGAATSSETRIVPRALRTRPGTGRVDLSAGVQVHSTHLDPSRLRFLRELAWQSGLRHGPHRIDVSVSSGDLPSDIRQPEGYSLRVSRSTTTIVGFDEDGARHGLISLLSLLTGDLDVPEVQIEDAPRYRHRGLMLDLARNLPGHDTLHLILDQMMMLKLNKLHLHLSDDEGWRIEIPELPELTCVGAGRGHTEDESEFMLPLLGSGPGGTSGSGFLSAGQYMSLVAAADERGIEVIPEIDVPGHSRAAVIAMEQRYRSLVSSDPAAAIRYRLLDPDDATNLTTMQLYDRVSLINPALDSSLHFLDVVMGTIARYHQQAGQPLRHWHLGGDEVMNVLLGPFFTDACSPESGLGLIEAAEQHPPWQASPAALALVADGTVSDVGQLFDRLLRLVDRLVCRHAIPGLLGWQDAFRDGVRADQFLSDVSADVWQTLDQEAAQSQADLANRGFGVVSCPPEFCYFDLAQSPDPDEPGVDWAYPEVDDWQVFNFAPDNLPQVAEVLVDKNGDVYQLTTPEQPADILGIQSELWTEFIREDDLLLYMLFPRLLASAERGWHRADWELDPVPGREYSRGSSTHVDVAALRRDWWQFATVVGQRILPRLDRAGIGYRIPPPGAVVVDGMLHVNTRYPGILVQYRFGDCEWESWETPVPVPTGETIRVRSGSPDGARWTRSTPIRSVDPPDRVEKERCDP